MYPLIPPTTGLEGGIQLTVKDEGGPELENVITTGPGAEGTTEECSHINKFRKKNSVQVIVRFGWKYFNFPFVGSYGQRE